MCPGVESDHPGTCPKCGMALERRIPSAGGEDEELTSMTRRLRIGATLTVPVVVLAMGAHFPPLSSIPPSLSGWIQLALSTPVVLWAGAPFFQRGFDSLVNRRLNMFTLISLGTGTAFVFSCVALFAPGLLPHAMRHAGMLPVYFEAAAAITTLVLLGQVLELRARGKTGDALRQLISLAPKTAHRLLGGGEEDVALDRVVVGDVLRVKPGEHVPVDGIVLEGLSDLDESMLTGEPFPVTKTTGGHVTAGTLNGRGSFLMKAERVGETTMLARIVSMVSEAQRSRAPVQKLADAVAAWFAPAVVAIAAVTFLAWLRFGPEPAFAYALVNAVAVLIIACPCALGLATPMSIMVAVGRGASMGILIKDAESLQRLEKVDTLVVDKTGTLTEGRLSLAALIAASASNETTLLSTAASLEAQSEHPLAGAVLRAAAERKIPPAPITQFEMVAGSGVRGMLDGGPVIAGTRRLLAECGIPDLSELDPAAARLQSDGHTVIRVARDGRAIGILAFSDPVKTSTPEAVASLQNLGLRILLLTGDNAESAGRMGRALGIAEVSSGVSPAEKHDRVRQLKSEGRVVAMAGDGINDAPALAAADVGIAMGTGTDIAMHSAGVTLVKGDLRGIAGSIALGRASMRNIRQNLAFAFLYNALGIPLAAGVLFPSFGILLSPVIASAAMSLSSVCVIANALRLRHVNLMPGRVRLPQ